MARSARPKAFARTLREADVYVDIECASRGEIPLRRERREVRRGGREWMVYAIRCQSGKLLELEFEQGGLPAAAGGDSSFGEGPSRLLDAGDWLRYADEQEEGVPRHATGLSEGQRRTGRLALEAAAAAYEEILKLADAGAGKLTPAGARSERSGAYLAKNLARVRRDAVTGKISELRTRISRLRR